MKVMVSCALINGTIADTLLRVSEAFLQESSGIIQQ